MQTLPMRQEYDCFRQKELRAGAKPRTLQRRFRLKLRRH